jgi:hypothetical protein
MGFESRRRSISSIATGSASSSVNSLQSNRGRNTLQTFFSRGSSSSYGASPVDDEFGSSSFTKEVLPSPGRRGPLSEAARATLKAVKAVGACWRCKVLRKKVKSIHKKNIQIVY